jgi:hypothetical protein
VTYSIQHYVDYGTRRDPADHCAATDYKNQTVEITLGKGQELNTNLESLFGWPVYQASYMEGVLLIRPDSPAAGGRGTTVASSLLPNTFGTGLCKSDPVMSVKLDSPVAKTSGSVEVSASTLDTPFYRVQKVEFYVDSKLAGTKTGQPYKFNWDTTSVSNGAHVLAIKALDAEGNSASDTESVIVFNPAAH